MKWFEESGEITKEQFNKLSMKKSLKNDITITTTKEEFYQELNDMSRRENLSGMRVEENTLYGIDVEESMSHIDVIFTKIKAIVPINAPISGGLWNCAGDILISVIRRGAFVFRMDKDIHSAYLAEKLNLELPEADAVKILFIRLNNQKITL